MQDMESINETVADNIRRLRKSKGWTQHDLAVESGLSFRGVQDIEAGKRSPRTSTLQAIAGALGVSEAFFFADHDSDKNTLQGTFNQMIEAMKSLPLSPEEIDLLRLFKLASSAQRDAIMKTIRNLVKSK